MVAPWETNPNLLSAGDRITLGHPDGRQYGPIELKTLGGIDPVTLYVRGLDDSIRAAKSVADWLDAGWRVVEFEAKEDAMTTPDLPMPGETFGTEGATVIASCWGNDDPKYGPLSCTLLLLGKKAPYYILYDMEVGQCGAWVVNASWNRGNIIPATELYSELIEGF